MVPSKLGLKPGSSIKVEDAILSLVTKSANDIAAAIAEKIGGTESRFAVMMTRKANEIGMSRTRYMNASGLHHPKQVTTARDQAKLGRHLIRRYPIQYKYFSTRNFSYNGHSYRNHNRLMVSYDGMDGIKTGYINASGFNLLASAKRGNRRLIGVVFGGRTANSRNAHMKEILDKGFVEAKTIRIARNPPPVPKEKPVAQLAMMHMQPANSNVPDAVAASKTPMQQLAHGMTKAQLDELAGQGDIDQDLLNRFETGLLTATTHTGKKIDPSFKGANVRPGNNQTALSDRKVWSIQIGAFSNRAATNKVLDQARSRLPPSLQHSTPFIAPVKSGERWMYRAWLTGLNQQEAKAACGHYKDCIVVDPPSTPSR
jgi:D-alanyl-D-alanine carboxypeptidase